MTKPNLEAKKIILYIYITIKSTSSLILKKKKKNFNDEKLYTIFD